MSNKFTDINIKNRTYYFFNDMININIKIIIFLIILKQMKTNTKIFLFTTLDM